MAKVFNAAIFNNIVLSSFVQLIGSDDSVVIDLNASNFWRIPMTGDIAAFSFMNLPTVDNQLASVQIVLEGDGTPRSIVWPMGTLWAASTEPTLSGGTDVVQLVSWDRGTSWLGFLLGQDFGAP